MLKLMLCDLQTVQTTVDSAGCCYNTIEDFIG